MNPSETQKIPKGRGRAIWKQGQEHKELRRPHVNEKIGNSSDDSQPDPGAGGDVPQLTSKLSATAKEFYPKGYNPCPIGNSYSQFMEATQEAGDGSNYDVSSPSNQANSVQIATEHLTEIINHLILDPGRFDALISPLVDSFKIWLSDENIIYAVIDVIVEQSITEPNFRYTGARLCSFLNNEFSTAEQHAFRSTLLIRCHQEQESMTNNMYADPERLRGYILFMAELFMQLEVGKVYGERAFILGKQLLDALVLLLSEPSSENIKCVCQVLKLTGQPLDMHESSSMNNVIHRLSILANDRTMETNVHHLINNVVQLRELGWGEPSNVMSKSATSQQYNSYSNEPVFYGPDGQIITPEESQFLQESFRQIPDDDYDDFGDDGEYWVPNEEMDEEHKVAFEQFLKMGKNQSS